MNGKLKRQVKKLASYFSDIANDLRRAENPEDVIDSLEIIDILSQKKGKDTERT